MSSQRIALLERTLGRIRKRSDGPRTRLQVGAVLASEALAAATLTPVTLGSRTLGSAVIAGTVGVPLDPVDEHADADMYDALTSPGHDTNAPPAREMLLNTGAQPAAQVLLADDVGQPQDSRPQLAPSAADEVAEQPADEQAIAIDDDEDVEIVVDDDVEIAVDVAADEKEAAPVGAEATVVEDIAFADEDAMFEGSTMISEVEHEAAERERNVALARALTAEPRFLLDATPSNGADRAAIPALPAAVDGAEAPLAADAPSSAPALASFAVPPAPEAAESLVRRQGEDELTVLIAPQVTSRPSIAATNVADMIGGSASQQKRSFSDALAATLALRFRAPPRR